MNNIYIGTALFLLGCYAALTWELTAIKLVFLGLAIGSVVLGVVNKRVRKQLSVLTWAIFCLVGLWAGASAPIHPAKELQPYLQQQVVAYGSIDPASVKRYEYGTAFVLRCEQLYVEGGQQKPIAYSRNLRIFTKDKELPLTGKVWCRGNLASLNSLRNPGGFDGERWHHINGLGGRLRKTTVQVVSTEGSLLDNFALWNSRLREMVAANVEGQAGALLAGMVLGGSVGLDDVTREIFAANGLAHLLSVSGTHMVLLSGFLWLALRFVTVRLRRWIVLMLLTGYALLCGLRPPVVRALCMSGVVLFGGSGAVKGNLLCLLATVLLIFQPLWLWDVGFQLSFGAVAGLLWFYPKAKNLFCAYVPNLFGEALAITLVAQLGVLPFLVGYFHQLSIVGFISNILLVPVLELATLLALGGSLLLCVAPECCVLLQAAGWLTKQILVQAELLAGLPYSTIVIGSLPLWCGVLYYFGLLLWADLPCVQFLRNMERRVLLGVTATALSLCLLWKNFAPQPFTAYFLDVGQGDSAVLVTPERQVLVIDTGGLKNFDMGSRVVAPFLRSLGISKVDLLLLSHGDDDHAGGAAGLARNICIERIVFPAGTGFSTAEDALLKRLGTTSVERAVQGKRYQFGEVVLELVDVPVVSRAAKGNEVSTVAAVRYGSRSLLFTGDIDAAREGLLQLGRYDVLKVAHHGSKHSSSSKFLQAVTPQVAVISAGAGNRYGHPHPETLARLTQVGSSVLRTDELGAIKVVFDGKQIRCYSYRYNKRAF